MTNLVFSILFATNTFELPNPDNMSVERVMTVNEWHVVDHYDGDHRCSMSNLVGVTEYRTLVVREWKEQPTTIKRTINKPSRKP